MKIFQRFFLILSVVLCTLLYACKAKTKNDKKNNIQLENLIAGENSTNKDQNDGKNKNDDKGDGDIASTRRIAITRSIEKVSPAVVGINVTEVREIQNQNPFGFDEFFGGDPMFQQYFGRKQKQEIKGLGSGFIISEDGYILTNDHVAGKASKVVITMTNGKKFDAKIIGSDPTSDVALLKIDGNNFPFVELGNSDDLIVGEWAIAFGNPFGLFDINSKPTVTVGVISNINVNLGLQDDKVYKGMIQTDAAISSGNSGGPLVNGLGQVIGINSTIYSTAQNGRGAGSIGIGFAIPINKVKKVVDALKNGGIDRNFWTGLRISQIDDRIQRYLKLDSKEGVVVMEVYPSSPANSAGIEPGDVIMSINGELIKSENKALEIFTDAKVDDKLKLKIKRDNKLIETILLLSAR